MYEAPLGGTFNELIGIADMRTLWSGGMADEGQGSRWSGDSWIYVHGEGISGRVYVCEQCGAEASESAWESLDVLLDRVEFGL